MAEEFRDRLLPALFAAVADRSAGAKAVERLSTRLVVSSYSWRSCEEGSASISFSRARKAILASSFWDIWTVVNGGVVNSAKRMSSNPTTERPSEEHTSELQSLRHLVCRL